MVALNGLNRIKLTDGSWIVKKKKNNLEVLEEKILHQK